MTYTFPPGTYVIGDPCYNLSQSQFDELLASSNGYKKEGRITLADGTTAPAVAMLTADGDGRYNDLRGFEYAVDSSTIGIIPIAAVQGGADEVDPNTKVVKFKQAFDVYDSAGTLVFGSIEINTHNQACTDDAFGDEFDDIEDSDDGFGF